MISVTENRAAQNPRAFLSRTQREALAAIGFFRNQVDAGPMYLIGSKRFAKKTVHQLERMALLRKSGKGYAPTMAGTIAIERLKGGEA